MAELCPQCSPMPPAHSPPYRAKFYVLAFFGSAWIAVIAIGFGLLLKHESSAGSSGAPCQDWPAKTGLVRASDRPTLVVFAHPQCPCTRAALSELAAILARCSKPVQVDVVFYAPPGSPPGWARTHSWEAAKNIPGVRVRLDPDAAEAEIFGIETSGHALLFGLDGKLRFSGGVTIARGHEGQSPVQEPLLALLSGESTEFHRSPVFGCALVTPTEQQP